LIVQWNYDIGGATTLILSTHDASDAVQLDLLFDERGIGVDGIMTPWIMRQRDVTSRWPRANPLHELLYLIRKRHRKGNSAAVRALVGRADLEYPRDRIRVEAFKIFRGSVARSVCTLLDDATADPVIRRPTALRPRLARWGQRMAS